MGPEIGDLIARRFMIATALCVLTGVGIGIGMLAALQWLSAHLRVSFVVLLMCGGMAQADDFTSVFKSRPTGVVEVEVPKPEASAPVSQGLPERAPRIVFFHAKWCLPCQAALRGPDSFPEWLRKAGWRVDESNRAHLQLVDVDANPEVASLHRVKLLPAMVLIVRDENDNVSSSEPVVYSGRASIISLLAGVK